MARPMPPDATSEGAPLPATMQAVVTTGNGGFERLVFSNVPMPVLRAGEVLLQVLAAGVNNTDINTRVGWYGVPAASPSGHEASASAAAGARSTAMDVSGANPAGWNGATPFPLIQGADCCGRVVALAADIVAPNLLAPDIAAHSHLALGQRVLVRSCMRIAGFDSPDTRWLGTDFDGAFAQYVKVPASEVFVVDCTWSDAELATIPCAYGTAENMLQRATVGGADHVLVTGASGGVGSAVVQLAKRRGARVTAITSRTKQDAVRALGADAVLCRDDDVLQHLGEGTVDVVVDNVAGAGFPTMLKLVRRGGRYVSSGAVAGANVALDMRDLYLKDISLLGCTAWSKAVFPALVAYIEGGEIRPLLAGTFALHDLASAQQAFLQGQHVGNFVVLP
jgi:NADPH:quinone reductase-like Zn-dependent oxidoreductase